MVIFGVTGDLARKKLLPAIYDLANRGLLPAGFALVGYGRRDWSKQDFEDYVCKAVKAGARTEFRENVWKRLAEGMHFVTGNFDDDAAFDQLENTLTSLDRERGTGLLRRCVSPATAFRHGTAWAGKLATRDH